MAKLSNIAKSSSLIGGVIMELSSKWRKVERLGLLFLLMTWGANVLAQKSVEQEVDSINAIPFAEITANPSQAAKTFEQYISVAEEANYIKGLAKLHANLTLAYYYLGSYEKSTELSLKAIELYEQIGDRGAVGNQLCETGYMMKRRDLDKAFEYMRSGLDILKKLGDEDLLSRNYNNFGVLHEMNDEIDSALYYYKAGLYYIEQQNQIEAISYSLCNIFEALIKDNKPDSALPYLERALTVRKQLGDEMGITESFALYGDYYYTKKLYPQAIESYKEALKRGEKHKYLYLMQYAAERISIIYDLKGDKAKALDYYKLFINYKDSLSNIETNKSIAELELRFETEKKEKELAQQKASLVQAAYKLRQRNDLLVGLVVFVLFVILAAYFIYRTQREKQMRLIEEARLKDQIAEIKLLNELQEERLRISRDLHDNIGSQLTFIISSLDNLRFLINKGEKNVNDRISGINEFARDTISQFRDTIWAMNKDSITVEDIHARLLNALSKARETGVLPDVRFNITAAPNYSLNGSKGIHLYRIIQEAINNAIKHAQATGIIVEIGEQNGKLEVVLKDNGIGFNQDEAGMGHGLGNMKKRANELGGEVTIKSEKGTGTTIIVRVPKNRA